MENSNKLVKFIKDNAADEDVFGGYHRNVADGLLNIIKGSQQSLSIAICGERGSGKSTILKILEKNLKDRPYAFLIYDAWTHQHDAPRRSFLLSLYEDSEKFLKESNCFNFQFFNLRKGKKFEKPSRHIEYLWGAFTLTYLIIIYFFKESISKHLIEKHVWENASQLTWLVINILIILLPILIYAFKLTREGIFSKISSVFGFAYTDSTSNKIDIEHSDFSKYFSCLCFQLGRIGVRPIIMVDNIDRIDNPDKEIEILTQIKTLFDAPSTQHDNLLPPILIATITPDCIKKISIQKSLDKTLNGKEDTIPPSVDAEKFFDVVITSINLGVLDNEIKRFFGQLLEEYITDVFETVRLNEYETYLAFQSIKSSYSNTPRGCKKYINDMIFELTLLENLIADIKTGKYIISDEDIWRVFNMYMAIRNHDDEELKRISSWGDNFERALKEIYPSRSFSSFALLQDMYNRFEARANDTYPISKRNIEPQLNSALYNILSNEKDKEPDEYTLHFYKSIHRKDHLIKLISENLQKNRFIPRL